MTPSPLNVTVEQQEAVFHCQRRSSEGIVFWRVNGTSPNSPNITTKGVPLSGGGYLSTLSIITLLDFNNTTIECALILFLKEMPIQFTTPAVPLLIQG